MFWGRVRQASGSFHISAYCVGIWKKNAKQHYTRSIIPITSVSTQITLLHVCLFMEDKKSEIVLLCVLAFDDVVKKSSLVCSILLHDFIYPFFFRFASLENECENVDDIIDNVTTFSWMTFFSLYRIWHFLTCCVDSFTYYV